jgi:hypothetical protein
MEIVELQSVKKCCRYYANCTLLWTKDTRRHLRSQERHPLGDAPEGDGMRIGDDLLATPQGMARGWGVGDAAPSSSGAPWRRSHQRHKGYSFHSLRAEGPPLLSQA